MSEIVNASAVRFDSLSATGDGYTLLSINGKVCKSDKLLSEMVQSAVDSEHFATEQWVNDQGFLKEHQSLDGYAKESWVSANYYDAGEVNDLLDEKEDKITFNYNDKDEIVGINNSAIAQPEVNMSADIWNSTYETVNANSADWGTDLDWSEIIEEASANAVDTVESKFEYDENDKISAYNGSAFAIPEAKNCNSWKQWSEDRNSSANDNINVYIGAGNRVDDSIYSFDIGSTNTAENSKNSFNIGIGNKIVSGTTDADTDVNIGGYNETSGGFNATNIGYMNKNVAEYDQSGLSALVTKSNKYAGRFTGVITRQEHIPGAVNLGYRNYQVNPAINIGGSNITLSGREFGDAINIGKHNINNYGIIIGQRNASEGYSFIIGQDSLTTPGSFAYGKEVRSYGGSYAFGDNVEGRQGSIVIGRYGATADGQSITLGINGVSSDGQALAIGSDGITARYGGITIGRNGVSADMNNAGATTGAAAIAIGSQGVFAQYGATAMGSNGVTAKNRHALAIGSEGVYAENGDSIAIGARGNTASNNSIHIGVKGKADNRSIIFNTSDNMNSHPGNFYANNYSLINYADECSTQATANIGSVVLGAGRNSLLSADKGSIIFDALAYDCDNVTGQRFLNYASQNSISLVTPSNNVDCDVIHNNSSVYRDTSYFTVKNNSLLLGAGTNGYLVVENDSYLIGGNTSGNSNGYAKNGSWVLGYNNMANGGNFILGHKNDAGGTSANIGTSAEVRPYNQSIILGNNNFVRNYKPYIYAPKSVFGGHKLFSAYISTDSYKDSRGAGTYLGSNEATVRNLVIGDYNRVTGYNAFVFGIGNYAGVESYDYNTSTSSISGDKDDDGFTFTFGMHSHAVRNYDIAIGLGTTASGGENIAIGTKASYESYQPYYTVAKGYKNIAYHSYIEGVLNIGFASNIPIAFDKSNDWAYTNNIFNTVTGNSWTYNIVNFHDNRFDCVVNNSLYTDTNFNRNTLKYINYSNIGTSGNSPEFTYNDLYFFDKSTLRSNDASRNIYRYISHSKININRAHGNIFHNIGGSSTGSTDFSANYATENILFNVGSNKYSNYCPGDKFLLTANNFGQNIIFNTTLMGYTTAGINQNTIFNSFITANHDVLPGGVDFGSDTIGHSFLYGTNVYGQAGESFSFAAAGSSATTGNQIALLERVSKIVNFGNNNIKNAYVSQIFGDNNTLYSVGNSFVAGRMNLVQGPRTGIVSNSYVTNSNTVFGEANAISNSDSNSNTSNDDRFTNSIILGKANGILKNCIDKKCYVTDNTIIGSVNGLYSIPATAIDNVISVGMYNWVNATAELPYHNILHYSNDKYVTSGQWLVNYYGNNASYNNARNLIMGSHSVISNNINDSTLIGSFNAAYNSATNAWSNNYVMGSFNLVANGSNQIVLGNSNIASGHNAMPMGEGLIANTSQTVFGRYNEVLDGTNGLSADGIDSKSGALLIVGNGRHILDKSDTASIERSNAMIVSADGTVSATRFATSGVADLEAKILELENIISQFSARWVLTNN